MRTSSSAALRGHLSNAVVLTRDITVALAGLLLCAPGNAQQAAVNDR